MIRAILACDDSWGIGKNGDLPWPHNSADLKWFKECTDDSIVVMGRKTWDSLPKRPLPNRENVVVTSNTGPFEGPHVVVDIRSLIKILPQMNFKKNVWIIGGASIFEQLLPYIDEIWLSRIEGNYDCDTHLSEDMITDDFTIVSMTVDEKMTIEKWVRR